jgi:hypothetical protein
MGEATLCRHYVEDGFGVSVGYWNAAINSGVKGSREGQPKIERPAEKKALRRDLWG